MFIDCHRCESRGLACGSCAATAIVTTAIVSQAPGDERGIDLDPAEVRALRVLANAGMIAPLRYAPRVAKAS